MTAFLKYAVIRLTLFIIPFGVMVLVGWNPLIAGGLSLLFASLASYIFLRRQRDDLAAVLAERAERRKQEQAASLEAGELDESVEDAILDERDAAGVEIETSGDGASTVVPEDTSRTSGAEDEAPETQSLDSSESETATDGHTESERDS